jgi:uncharacterized protein (TIGR02266 family)
MMTTQRFYNIALEQSFNDGEIIFEEGSSGDWVYVVVSGAVEVSKTISGKKYILSILEPGEVFGEIALIGAIKRTATIRAIGTTTVGIVDRSLLYSEFNELSSEYRAILVTLTQRFIKVMERTREIFARREARIKKKLSLNFKNRRSFISAYTHDISSGGLFIRTKNPLDIGEQFFIELRLPGLEGVLKAKCEVVWARRETGASGEKPAGMGVKFCEITEKNLQVLRNYIRQIGN